MPFDGFGQLIFFIGVLFKFAVIKFLGNFLVELVVIEFVHAFDYRLIAGFQLADRAVMVLNFVLVAFFESFLEPLGYSLVFYLQVFKAIQELFFGFWFFDPRFLSAIMVVITMSVVVTSMQFPSNQSVT